jgi:uncharacterized protein YdcH (DUF465 family)
MEAHEIELINQLAPAHDELRHLVQRHRGYEDRLAELEGVHRPSSAERQEITKLKRLKLRGKDRIQQILAAHRGV